MPKRTRRERQDIPPTVPDILHLLDVLERDRIAFEELVRKAELYQIPNRDTITVLELEKAVRRHEGTS